MKLAHEVLYPPTETLPNLPPIVLLHGFADSRGTWRIVLPAIVKATGRKAYAVDLRNHGDSAWSDQFDFDILTVDLIQFLDEHSLFRIILLAHSGAAKSAMDFALHQPQRVEKLIIEDMTPKPLRFKSNNFTIQYLTGIRMIVEAASITIDEISIKREIFDQVSALDPDNRFELKEILKNLLADFLPVKKLKDKYVMKANMDVILDFLRSKKLEKELTGIYNGDALFIYGTKTLYELETDDLIPKLFPKAIKKKIQNSSHFCHIENPDDYIRCVSDFILGNSTQLSDC